MDIHYVTNQEERREENWLIESDAATRRDRLVWVSGPPGGFEAQARDLIRSRHLIELKSKRLTSLTEGQKSALYHEQSRRDQLDRDLTDSLAALFLQGTLYFRARRLHTQRFGQSFPAVLIGAAEEVLPELYPHFFDLAVTESELKQLMQPSLVDASQKGYRRR